MLGAKELSQEFADLRRFGNSTRCQYLGVGAHQDDLEIMAADGIFKAQESDEQFAGVICTSGHGSARSGEFAGFTDEQMREVRRDEQIAAAEYGRYSMIAQLDFESKKIKNGIDQQLVDDLKAIIHECQPEIIYTHNFADKHQTHVGVAMHVVQALRELAPSCVKQVFGCEVWRNLDWMPDHKKIVFDLSAWGQQIETLISFFKSQTAGGKRYDLATLGRMKANATFFDSHEVDKLELACYAVDLMPLVEDKGLSAAVYFQSIIDDFSNEVRDSILKLGV